MFSKILINCLQRIPLRLRHVDGTDDHCDDGGAEEEEVYSGGGACEEDGGDECYEEVCYLEFMFLVSYHVY